MEINTDIDIVAEQDTPVAPDGIRCPYWVILRRSDDRYAVIRIEPRANLVRKGSEVASPAYARRAWALVAMGHWMQKSRAAGVFTRRTGAKPVWEVLPWEVL